MTEKKLNISDEVFSKLTFALLVASIVSALIAFTVSSGVAIFGLVTDYLYVSGVLMCLSLTLVPIGIYFFYPSANKYTLKRQDKIPEPVKYISKKVFSVNSSQIPSLPANKRSEEEQKLLPTSLSPKTKTYNKKKKKGNYLKIKNLYGAYDNLLWGLPLPMIEPRNYDLLDNSCLFNFDLGFFAAHTQRAPRKKHASQGQVTKILDDILKARDLSFEGKEHIEKKEFPEALKCTEKSYEMFKKVNENINKLEKEEKNYFKGSEAATLFQLAVIFSYMGQYQNALKHYNDALAIFTIIGLKTQIKNTKREIQKIKSMNYG